MNKQEYADYLKSDHWQKLKQTKKSAAKGKCPRCAICEKWNCIDLHHLNYDNLGKESLSDVEWLCKDCHKWAHRMAIKQGKKPTALFIYSLKQQLGITYPSKKFRSKKYIKMVVFKRS